MLIQLLGIQLITFIALLFILRALFYRQLSVAVNRLKRLHEENLARQEELKNELNKTRLERETELAKARQEADNIIKDAKLKSEKTVSEIEDQGRARAEKFMSHSKSELGKLEKDISDKCQKVATDLSMQMLKTIFTTHGSEALQRQLISEIIGYIEEMGKDEFTVKSKDVKAISARSLTKEEKAKIGDVLSKKIGTAVEVQESVDEDVVAGVIIKIGAFTIDGSIRNKLSKIAEQLKIKD